MTFSIIPVFTIVLLVGLCVYTWITRDKDDNAGDYNNMDRSATWLYLAGTYTATLVSAVGMVGLPGQSYTTGYMYGLANWGSTIGLMLSALFFGPQIRKFGKTTVAEFFQFRFDSKAFRLIVAIITVLGTGAYFVSQTIGAAVILETIVGIPFNTTVIIVVVIVAYLALVGGAKTVTVTDTILFCVIAVALGVVFAPTVIGVAGGLPAMKILAGTTPEFLKLGGLANAPFGTMVGFIMLWALGIGAAPVNLSRAFLAKSNREWLKGMMVAFCVTVFMIWSVHSAAAYGRLINPDLTSGSQVMPWLALNAVPKAIGLAGVPGPGGCLCLHRGYTAAGHRPVLRSGYLGTHQARPGCQGGPEAHPDHGSDLCRGRRDPFPGQLDFCRRFRQFRLVRVRSGVLPHSDHGPIQQTGDQGGRNGLHDSGHCL